MKIKDSFKKTLKKHTKLRLFVNNLPLIIVAVIAIFIYCTNLSGQDYSLDEPETIILANTIPSNGVPTAWNGQVFISTANGLDSKLVLGKYIWTWHPWLQHYVAKAGILLFGQNPGGTRFLFALIGALTVILLFKTSMLIFKDKLISFVLALQLVFSLPFFLYSRQVRYYSLSSFFSFLLFFLFVKYLQKKFNKKDYTLFLMGSMLLFFSNYLIWLCYMIVAAILILKNRDKTLFKLTTIQAVFVFFWLLIFKPYNGDLFLASHGPMDILIALRENLSYINAYLFPLFLIPIFLILGKRGFNKFFYLSFGLIFVNLILAAVFLVTHGRYIIHLAPILILFYGIIYYYFKKRFRVLIPIMGFIFITTTFLNTLPLQLIKHYVKEVNVFDAYRIELTKHYQTYLPQLTNYLKNNYHKGDLYLGDFSYSVYNDANVPFFSTACNSKTGQYEGPPSVTDPNFVRWIYFLENKYPLDISSKSICFKNLWNQISQDFVLKKIEVKQPAFNLNDSDIVSRDFPPLLFNQKYLYLYERKPTSFALQ